MLGLQREASLPGFHFILFLFWSLSTALPFCQKPHMQEVYVPHVTATYRGSVPQSNHCRVNVSGRGRSARLSREPRGPTAGHVTPPTAGPAPGRLEATSMVAGRDHGWRACVPRPSGGARMKCNAITARVAESPSGRAVDADRPHHETPPPPAAAVPAGLPRRRAAPRRPRR